MAIRAFAVINGQVLNFANRQLSRPTFLSLVGAVLVVSALVRAVNHDESQYVAAIALMREGMPYRDFAYLQTPLQPLLLSPLAYLPAGWVWIGTRAMNAAFGFATLLLVIRASANRASPAAELVAAVALLCTEAFLLASSVARNDALPMVLIAASLPFLLSAVERRSVAMFGLGGLALGLAASAKISAALPAAAAGLFPLLRVRDYGIRSIFAFGAGLLLGLLPTIGMALIAPSEFRFDVFDYNVNAPVQWWTSVSQAGELDPFRRVVKLARFSCVGSILVALTATALDRRPSAGSRMLELMIAAGLIAAFLPKPALVQYLIPLLPPLFVRFAIALDGVSANGRKALLVLTGAGSLAGLFSDFVVSFGGLEMVRAVPFARRVELVARNGRVVSLFPEYVAGSGVLLDPRFAAGPFLYRTRGPLGALAEIRGKAVSIGSLDKELDSLPPAVIVVGGESHPHPPPFPDGFDQPLVDWARAHGYRTGATDGKLIALFRPG